MQNMDHLCMGCMSDNGGEQICSVCGFDQSTYNVENALPLRKILAGRYVIGKAVSSNGEGFTYIGMDTVTDSVVKITEYFPTGLCWRQADGSVEIKEESSYLFNDGIIQFISLHKKLAIMTDISAIYRVLDIFEINKTAYCVTEYLPGISLKEFLIRNGSILTWEQVRPLFLPLIASLRLLHYNGIVHGGISPETLLVGRDGRIRIIDFAIPAVRNARSEMTAQLFPGFAAIEQYRGGALTPATDVYAFAATMFRTLTGNPPPDSKRRLDQDNMTFPRSIAEQMPRSVLVAMANALQIESADRTQTMEAFRNDLQPTEPAPAPSVEYNKVTPTPVPGTPAPKKKKGNNKKYVLISALITAAIFAVIAIIVYFVLPENDEKTPDESSSKSTTSVESELEIIPSDTEKIVSVPNILGKTYDSVIDEYGDDFEIVVVDSKRNDDYASGDICEQKPAPNARVTKGSKIEVCISAGPSKLEIPRDIVGMTKEQAKNYLTSLGFDKVEFVLKVSDTESGSEIVIGTDPGVGKQIDYYRVLTVYHTPYKEPQPVLDESTANGDGGSTDYNNGYYSGQ